MDRELSVSPSPGFGDVLIQTPVERNSTINDFFQLVFKSC